MPQEVRAEVVRRLVTVRFVVVALVMTLLALKNVPGT